MSRFRRLLLLPPAFLLTACSAGPPEIATTGGGLKPVESTGQFPADLHVELPPAGADMAGQAPPSLSFNTVSRAPDDFEVMVASGRIIPVADKESQQIIGWRLSGELYNGGSQIFSNGQVIIELQSTANPARSQNLLPQAVQSGGFIPLEANEWGVYDVLVSRESLSLNRPESSASPPPPAGSSPPASSATAQESAGGGQIDKISIGIRKIEDESPWVRLKITDLEFVRQADRYLLRGTITNNLKKPITRLLVRYWAVIDQGKIPEGARTADQVMAANTWMAEQAILTPGQTYRFESGLLPFTVSDQQQMAEKDPQLSALAAGQELK